MKTPVVKKIGSVVWVHANGKTFTVDVGGKRGAKKAGVGEAGDGTLSAPMPGKILKICVQPGEAVNKGQTVIIMEAMKMEYALKAPFAGKMKAVHRDVGDQVPLGEKLAEIQ